MLTEEQKQQLISKCLEMQKFSYCPYSNFAVGAGLMSTSGKIYGGCNIENSAYGSTICAERCAVFKAISEGEKLFTAIAITGGKVGGQKLGNDLDFAYPCGSCRQVMREFCDPKKFTVIICADEKRHQEYTLEDLLPHSFGPANLIENP